MTQTHDRPEGKPGFFTRHPCAHFLWASPLAFFCGLYVFVLAAISVCGVSGCSGGGYGVSRGDPVETALLVTVGAVVMTLPIGAIPWHTKFAVRVTTMLAIAALLGIVVWLGIAE